MVKIPEYMTHRAHPLFIDGKWLTGRGAQTIEVVDPCRNRVFATIGTASPDQIESAATNADRAFQAWRHTSGAERSDLLISSADGLIVPARRTEGTANAQ